LLLNLGREKLGGLMGRVQVKMGLRNILQGSLLLFGVTQIPHLAEAKPFTNIRPVMNQTQPSGVRCFEQSSKILSKRVSYCLDRRRPDLPQKAGEPVIYFFHGIGGGTSSWKENGYEESLRILSTEENFPPFTVVSFDTSDLSFFSDAGGETRGSRAYESWFIEELVPHIEKMHGLCSERKCRGTAGVSMGGLGALKTALRHSDKFRFAAANSPALVPFNPWESNMLWNDYFSRNEVGLLQGRLLLQSARDVFTNWDLGNYNDPSWLVGSFEDLEMFPELYFDVGGKDYFGFHEGFGRFQNALNRRGITYESYFDPNGSHELFWDRRWWLMRFLKRKVQEL